MDDECDQLQQDVFDSEHQMTAGKNVQVVAYKGQLSSKSVLMNEDDVALILKARERLAAPQRIKISMDDL
ncbi:MULTISPECIES: hypothetical protein [unclassified Pseudomonas]|uniref:hypothetical protein n=1 Tax=unclassified Pseudomonas TaxID=196821 RepID=UPI00087F8A7A|nr:MULTISPECIES: hypothetical protein [unclassified Pseudomonas]SDB21194.1 hypothetical protein SAMN03159290_01584 [Pseudomonas sp. NFACC13-1]SFO49432.1 hypothetical protein SAMN03159304_03592 [Pseudomonas sp. NFACC24-1]